MYTILLCHSLPSQLHSLLGRLGHSIEDRREDRYLVHRLVSESCWFTGDRWVQVIDLHEYKISYRWQGLLLGSNWSIEWTFSIVLGSISSCTRRKSHRFYWWSHIRGYLWGGKSSLGIWFYTPTSNISPQGSIGLYPRSHLKIDS